MVLNISDRLLNQEITVQADMFGNTLNNVDDKTMQRKVTE
jgi:hypothetical protein